MPEPTMNSRIEALLHEYHRMILRLATLFHRRCRSQELEDWITEGQIAVMVAFPRYRGLKNARLSTYLFRAIYFHFQDQMNREARFESHCVGGTTQLEAVAAKEGASLDLADEVAQLLEGLPTRWQQVLVAHYGLHGQTPQSFRQIAAEWGVSKQRIEQLHRQALNHLRG